MLLQQLAKTGAKQGVVVDEHNADLSRLRRLPRGVLHCAIEAVLKLPANQRDGFLAIVGA
jgi:hypothetical protein